MNTVCRQLMQKFCINCHICKMPKSIFVRFFTTVPICSFHKVLLLLLHTFNDPFLCQPRWTSTCKVKPIWILLKQETVSGSGISWAICKSAPHSREITTPAPHHFVFTGRMPFLPPNQQCQSTECRVLLYFKKYFCGYIFDSCHSNQSQPYLNLLCYF